MTAQPAEPTPTAPATTEPPAAAATPPAEAPKPTGPPKTADPAEPGSSLPNDPAELHGIIRDLRRENATRRVDAKTAADEARKEVAQTIGKALGFVEDGPIDPAKLTESLTTAQAEAKQARVELAVFRAAADAGGDPARLLEHKSFSKSLDSIDPTDTAAVAAAIQSAVEANPWLGATPTGPKAPAPNPAQGSSAAGPSGTPQLTEADVKRLSDAGKHAEIVQAREEGRLDTYLGIK